LSNTFFSGLGSEKTRLPGLPYGVDGLMTASAASVQYSSVTDGQTTDGHIGAAHNVLWTGVGRQKSGPNEKNL